MCVTKFSIVSAPGSQLLEADQDILTIQEFGRHSDVSAQMVCTRVCRGGPDRIRGLPGMDSEANVEELLTILIDTAIRTACLCSTVRS